MSDSLQPKASPGQNTEAGSLSILQGIFPTQELNLGLLHWQVDSLPAESQGKPKNTGVGNLSLLQWIFPTQEFNQGLLHCRWILYQLSYQGSALIPKAQQMGEGTIAPHLLLQIFVFTGYMI